MKSLSCAIFSVLAVPQKSSLHVVKRASFPPHMRWLNRERLHHIAPVIDEGGAIVIFSLKLVNLYSQPLFQSSM